MVRGRSRELPVVACLGQVVKVGRVFVTVVFGIQVRQLIGRCSADDVLVDAFVVDEVDDFGNGSFSVEIVAEDCARFFASDSIELGMFAGFAVIFEEC